MSTATDIYEVDLSTVHTGRRPGVSGMMRVRNDGEFIEPSVKSCIDALDELVIVYNDCSDNSADEIERMRALYPDKIKVFNYPLYIKAWQLDDSDVEKIESGEIEAPYTLAGYYNFALSKTTCSHVMKIDADQMYLSSKLKELCDAFRAPAKSKLTVLPDLLRLISMKLFVRNRLKRKAGSPVVLSSKKWKSYYRSLLNVVAACKPNVCLHGVNAIPVGDCLYVSLGEVCESNHNIMPPFNGGNDHPIFRVTEATHFVPYFDKTYNKLNNKHNSVIESLVGLGSMFMAGISWVHLNAWRSSVKDKTLANLKSRPDCFVEIDKLNADLIYRRPCSAIFTDDLKVIAQILVAGLDDKMRSDLKKMFL